MPFGLCNAPVTFQLLMALVLAGLQWSHCLVYLDDIIVLGRTFTEHLANFQLVLGRLHQAGLKSQPKKCEFLQHKVHYLGHIVSDKGVAADPTKTEKVATWPTPTTIKSSAVFGICGILPSFYPEFCPDSQASASAVTTSCSI